MSEITKNQIKLIRSLQQKKGRRDHNLFVVEGIKNVLELIHSSFQVEHVFATEEIHFDHEHQLISKKELVQLSSLKQPEGIIAVAKIKKFAIRDDFKLTLVLDNINDPGNLGTIIRTADWFGVDQIICSEQTVDCYNSKVVQTTKGSIFHVPIIYTDLTDYLKDQKNVYGASLDGSSLETMGSKGGKVLVMGSESHGISKEVQNYVQHLIKIPSFGKAESLNVAIATGILLNEFKK